MVGCGVFSGYGAWLPWHIKLCVHKFIADDYIAFSWGSKGMSVTGASLANPTSPISMLLTSMKQTSQIMSPHLHIKDPVPFWKGASCKCTSLNHNGILSTTHARKTVETPFTMRERSYSCKSQWNSVDHTCTKNS